MPSSAQPLRTAPLRLVRLPGALRPLAPGARAALGAAATTLLALAACDGGAPPTGLAAGAGGNGPIVRFEPLDEPDPEIPFPNDLATRFDADSPTGRRLNLGLGVPTELEADLRRHYNELDGFGTYAPLSVAFDAPLDLGTVRDDTVIVVNIDEASPYFGERVPLDLGRGAFPVAIQRPDSYFPNDPSEPLPDFIYPPGNAVDRDHDGVAETVYDWEVATNTLVVRPLVPMHQATRYAVVLTRGVRGLGGDPVRSPFPWVNHAAQTEALEPLGRALAAGGEGRAVPAMGDVAFTWVFTTQSVTRVLERVRDGLDGQGPLGWLRESRPPVFAAIKDLGITHDGDGSMADRGLPAVPRDTKYILQPALLERFIENPAVASFGSLGDFSLPHVDYIVFGTFDTANLRSADDRIFDLDPDAGRALVGHELVTFMITIPKATEQFKPPFPVALYAHGARVSRFEPVVIADRFAQAGIAIMALDAVGHGPVLGNALQLARREIGDDLLVVSGIGAFTDLLAPSFDLQPYIQKAVRGEPVLDELFTELTKIGLVDVFFSEGRTEDADGDGERESGDSFFVPNLFQFRDAVRQTTVDYMFALRLLKGLRPDAVPPAIDDPAHAPDALLQRSLLAGDFNADGVLDLGGPDARFFTLGTSLGGINSSVLAAVEPNIRASAHIVNGGGWADMLVRSTLRSVVDNIFLEVMGPVVIGCKAPDDSGDIVLTFNAESFECNAVELAREGVAAGRLPAAAVATGAALVLENLDNGEVARGELPAGGLFSLAVAADVGDRLRLRVVEPAALQALQVAGAGGATTPRVELPAAAVRADVTLVARHDGLGRVRNTPRVRRIVGLSQIVVEAADPINYARHLFLEPLAGMPAKRVLHLADPGDYTVPFATMVAWDRAAGLLGTTQAEWGPLDAQFIAHESFTVDRRKRARAGQVPLWDPDDLDRDNGDDDGDGAPDRIGPLPLRTVDSEGGRAAVRYHNADNHGYVCCVRPSDPIDWGMYSRNQMVQWFSTTGTLLSDDLCMQEADVAACCARKRERGEPIDAALQWACEYL